MKIGIFYAGKTGTAETCARKLGELLNAACFNLETDQVNPDAYEIIIIGSSIRMGKIHPRMKKFLKRYKDLIQGKAYGIFITQGLPETYEKVMASNFSESFRKNAVVCKSFGGDLQLEKQKGLSKLMVKVMMKSFGFKKPEIDWQAIGEFAEAVKKFAEGGRK